jgi:2,3-bisphosphoglycerate-independent phosphoglycerate mutase
VHAHQAHLIEAARVIAAEGVPVAIHAITDGRDVPPKSAIDQIAEAESALPRGVRVVTVTGRYFAMDRDNRWERVALAYRALVFAEGQAHAASAQAAIAAAYAEARPTNSCPPR